MRWTPALVLLVGCELFEQPEPPNCEPRTAFYADEDGDGVADAPGAIYLGCRQPDGYVTGPPTPDTDADSDPPDSDPPDSDPPDSDPPDSDTDGDSDPPDSDPPDSDAVDSDPADTDPTDTP